MKREIAVTGLGLISPLGNDVDSFWNALLKGESGVGAVTHFDASALESRIAAEVKNFDPSLWMDKREARKMALFSQYAVAASVQAWRDAGFREDSEGALDFGYRPERVGVCLGNGIGGIDVFEESHTKLMESGPDRLPPMTVPLMIANEAAGNVAMRLKIHGPAFTQVTACASGTDAIGQAIDLLRAGRLDVVVAGGTEAAITLFAMSGFCKLKALSTGYNDRPTQASRPFDLARDGFVIGEGAGVLILENYERARARKANIRAIAAGYGASCDAYHLTAPDPQAVQGARALALALEDAGLGAEDVGYYNAHGTSTPLNDPTETLMVKHCFREHAKTLKISSTKSMTGHCSAAAGALEAIVCIKALETGWLPPTINLDSADTDGGCDLDYIPNRAIQYQVQAALSASLGFGGHNGALAFKKV